MYTGQWYWQYCTAIITPSILPSQPSHARGAGHLRRFSSLRVRWVAQNLPLWTKMACRYSLQLGASWGASARTLHDVRRCRYGCWLGSRILEAMVAWPDH